MANTVEDTLIVRMEASLRKFERQMESGRKSAEKAAVGAERAWQRGGERIAANANRAATGLERITNVSGRGRFVIQNTANQIGDMAVQIGGGTSAMKAMGQQLPQLFGGFGALGGSLGLVAPLLGTVAALGLPIAAAFLAANSEAESLDDTLKELAASLTALESAQKRASMSVVDLFTDYGSLADEARALFEIEKQMAQIRAQAALDNAARGIAGALGVGGALAFEADSIRNLDQTIERLREERRKLNEATYRLSDEEFRAAGDRIAEINEQIDSLRPISRNLDDLADNLGITEDAAREVAAQFAAIGQADSTAERASAMQDLVSYIKDASSNLADAEDEGRELYSQLLEASLKALELSKVDIASNIGSGADEAARLADNLLDALNRQNALAAGYSVGEPDENGNVYGGRGRGPTAAERAEMRIGYVAPPEKTTSRARGGGGRSSVDPRTQEAARIFEQTRTEAEKYARELGNLNQLRESGYISENTHLRAVKQLGEQFNETANIGEQMGRTISDSLADMVVNFDSARDAAANLLRQLASMVANSAFSSLGLDNFFGGLFANAKGNAFQGGRVTPFANGGVVSGPTMFPMRGNRTGLMGEAGPEAIMPLTRTANGKLGVQAQGGRGGNVDVRVYMDGDGNWQAEVERISGNVVARAAPAIMGAQDRKTAANIQNFSARQG